LRRTAGKRTSPREKIVRDVHRRSLHRSKDKRAERRFHSGGNRPINLVKIPREDRGEREEDWRRERRITTLNLQILST